jgi:hypothetical protein
MRRLHLRKRDNILKRLLIHVSGFNLSLLMRKLIGKGTPRGLQGLVGGVISLFWWIITGWMAWWAVRWGRRIDAGEQPGGNPGRGTAEAKAAGVVCGVAAQGGRAKTAALKGTGCGSAT